MPILPSLLTPSICYLVLGEGDGARRTHYGSLFAGEIPEGELAALREATSGGFALGSDRFQRQIAAMVGRRTWPRKSGRPKKEAPNEKQVNLSV